MVLILNPNNNSVAYLAGVGNGDYDGNESYRDLHTTQEAYDHAIRKWMVPSISIIVASLTIYQNNGAQLLIRNGFIKIGSSIVNHNSNNYIVLYMKMVDNAGT